jgi:hypothetical protein
MIACRPNSGLHTPLYSSRSSRDLHSYTLYVVIGISILHRTYYFFFHHTSDVVSTGSFSPSPDARTTLLYSTLLYSHLKLRPNNCGLHFLRRNRCDRRELCTTYTCYYNSACDMLILPAATHTCDIRGAGLLLQNAILRI